MLIGFDNAFREFERDAYSLLHESYFDPCQHLAKFKIQIQAQSLATDLGYLSMVMRDLYEDAMREVSQELDRDNADYQSYLREQVAKKGSSLVLDQMFFEKRPRREQRISVALAKFGAGFKAFLFPVRAFQDALYKVGLCVVGQSVGGKSSMTRAVDKTSRRFMPSNPIAQILAAAVPEYPQWFSSLRGTRDFIKYGAGVSYSSGKDFVTGETTVAIAIHTNSDDRPSVSLDDVSSALEMSARATAAIVRAGIANGMLNPRAS